MCWKFKQQNWLKINEHIWLTSFILNNEQLLKMVKTPLSHCPFQTNPFFIPLQGFWQDCVWLKAALVYVCTFTAHGANITTELDLKVFCIHNFTSVQLEFCAKLSNGCAYPPIFLNLLLFFFLVKLLLKLKIFLLYIKTHFLQYK